MTGSDPVVPRENPRVPAAEVDSLFYDRWSPRSFLDEALPREVIAGLLEAARWSPSCYNEQPWLFMVAADPAERDRYAQGLVEKNRQWAGRAPVLIYLFARRRFARNDKPNRHAAFDAGAAWMALALQARRFGLHAHAMAGFDVERAHALTGVPAEAYEALAAIAVGRRGAPEALDESMARIERPNHRKPHEEVGRFGRFEG